MRNYIITVLSIIIILVIYDKFISDDNNMVSIPQQPIYIALPTYTPYPTYTTIINDNTIQLTYTPMPTYTPVSTVILLEHNNPANNNQHIVLDAPSYKFQPITKTQRYEQIGTLDATTNPTLGEMWSVTKQILIDIGIWYPFQTAMAIMIVVSIVFIILSYLRS